MLATAIFSLFWLIFSSSEKSAKLIGLLLCTVDVNTSAKLYYIKI